MDDIILNQHDAVDYLEDIAKQHTEEVMAGIEDSEGMTELLEDLYTMKYFIAMHDYEFYKISEHPMSASGLIITPMVEKEL